MKHWEGTHPSSSFAGWVGLGYVSPDWRIGKNSRRGRELRSLAKEYISESFEIDIRNLYWIRDDKTNHCHLCIPATSLQDLDRPIESIRSFTNGFLDGMGYVK